MGKDLATSRPRMAKGDRPGTKGGNNQLNKIIATTSVPPVNAGNQPTPPSLSPPFPSFVLLLRTGLRCGGVVAARVDDAGQRLRLEAVGHVKDDEGRRGGVNDHVNHLESERGGGKKGERNSTR